jgi:hypothetical protein
MRRFVALSLATCALVMGGTQAGTAAAATTTGGCPASPSGFQLWPVSTEPYQADNAADFNEDGSVCARPTKDTFEEGGVTYTVYLFIDNTAKGA